MSAAESPVTDAARRVDDLYRRHAAEVFRYAYAVLGNRADAEDVTQTTFVNALRALERGEQPRKPAHWLIVIAHNIVRQRWRHAATHPTEVELVGDVAAAAPADDQPGLDELVHALQQIPPAQREALVMRELEGRSYAEIAEILGLTTGALETLLFRARRSLADELENLVTCERAELELTRRLDGRLGRKERRRLDQHLAACPSCARRAQLYARQRRAFTGLALLPLPVGASFGPAAPLGAGTGLAAIGGATTVGVGATGTAASVAGGTTGAGLLAGGLAKVAAVVIAGTVATGAAVKTAQIVHADAKPPAPAVATSQGASGDARPTSRTKPGGATRIGSRSDQSGRAARATGAERTGKAQRGRAVGTGHSEARTANRGSSSATAVQKRPATEPRKAPTARKQPTATHSRRVTPSTGRSGAERPEQHPQAKTAAPASDPSVGSGRGHANGVPSGPSAASDPAPSPETSGAGGKGGNGSRAAAG